MTRAAAELAAGRSTWFISLGSSMAPSLRTVQRVALRPVQPGEQLTGRIALAQVAGRFWLHRVVEERDTQVCIGSDNGMVNGWTPRGAVFGVID